MVATYAYAGCRYGPFIVPLKEGSTHAPSSIVLNLAIGEAFVFLSSAEHLITFSIVRQPWSYRPRERGTPRSQVPRHTKNQQEQRRQNKPIQRYVRVFQVVLP